MEANENGWWWDVMEETAVIVAAPPVLPLNSRCTQAEDPAQFKTKATKSEEDDNDEWVVAMQTSFVRWSRVIWGIMHLLVVAGEIHLQIMYQPVGVYAPIISIDLGNPLFYVIEEAAGFHIYVGGIARCCWSF